MASNSTSEVLCHVSEHGKRKLRECLSACDKEASIPLSTRHEPNYVIPMTKIQKKKLDDAKAIPSRVTVSVLFSLDQLKEAKKIEQSLVKHSSAPSSNKFDSFSMKELAEIYEQVCAAMKRKAEQQAEELKAAAANNTKRGPLITMLDTPSEISYNEKLYCGECKKRTGNESAKLTEQGQRHKVTAQCVDCKSEKSREVNSNKEIEDGRISFL